MTVDYTGNLTTYGEGATGIFAQSSGGQRGLTTNGSKVSVTVDGTVKAYGIGASAILAQSHHLQLVDEQGQPVMEDVGIDTITVTINPGCVVQGGKASTSATPAQMSAGVEFIDGLNNVLNNYGAITSLSGKAIAQSGYINNVGSGVLTVNNYGTITGEHTGNIILQNMVSGAINSGRFNWLGPNSMVINDGLISIMGDRSIGVTDFDTKLVQGPTGKIAFDLRHVPTPVKSVHADLLTIGGSADFAGAIDINIRDAGVGSTGRLSVGVIEAQGEIVTEQLIVIPSAVAQYELERPTANSVALTYDLDFLNPTATQKLNPNQTHIASHIDAHHSVGVIGEELLFLTEAEDSAAYGDSLDGLSPASYGVNASASLFSAMHFADSLMSCKESNGVNRFISEADCLRVDAGGRSYSQGSTSNSSGFDLDWRGIAIGGQTEVREGWIVGLGFGYDNLDGSSDGDLWRSDGDQFQTGVVVKRQTGPNLFAVSFDAGFGNVDIARNVAPGVTANGDQDFWFAGSQFRAARVFDFTDWYVKPIADLNVTYVNTSSVTEKGAGAANLNVDGSDDYYAAFRPTLEAGLDVEVGDGAILRPHASVGVTQFLTDPSQSVTAHLHSSIPDIAPFTVENDMDRTSLDLEIGLDIFAGDNVQLSLAGAAQISENANNVSGIFRLAVKF